MCSSGVPRLAGSLLFDCQGCFVDDSFITYTFYVDLPVMIRNNKF